MYSLNIIVITRWNVAGALQSPICIVWLTYVPYIVAKALFQTSSGSMRTYSYASEKSIFDRTGAPATSKRIWSWSGNGVTSFTVLSLRLQPSSAVHSRPVFFGIHNIGAAWSVCTDSHHPALVLSCDLFHKLGLHGIRTTRQVVLIFLVLIDKRDVMIHSSYGR